jgi:cation diffusion facilitator family transporter
MNHAVQKRVLGVLWLTLVLNLRVLAVKVLVGVWIHSLSVLADALHSVTDSAGNIVGLLAMRFASPDPDREHPYGHQKYEAVATLTIAFLLGVSCLEIAKSGVERLLAGDAKVDLSVPAIALMLAVLGVNIFTAYYERAMGRRLKSAILLADA